MPTYEMLSKRRLLDVRSTSDFRDDEEVFYAAAGDVERVSEGFYRNAAADIQKGLVSCSGLWVGPAIDQQPYVVVAAQESWYMLEGELHVEFDSGEKVDVRPGLMVTWARGERLTLTATPFRALFTILHMPEEDMQRMGDQRDWELAK